MNIIVDDISEDYIIESITDMENTWMDITKQIMNNNKLLYSVELDGIVYYDGYAEELLERYNEIQTVSIKTVTPEHSITITLQELKQYSAKVMGTMGEYIKPLYGNSSDESGEIISTVVGAVEWVGSSLAFLQLLSQQVEAQAEVYELANGAIEKLNPVLELLGGELEWGNHIGFADIIQYEFIPLVEEFYLKSEEVVGSIETSGYIQ
ncbi:hypothetical protein [Paenibacillus marinisediminis]